MARQRPLMGPPLDEPPGPGAPQFRFSAGETPEMSLPSERIVTVCRLPLVASERLAENFWPVAGASIWPGPALPLIEPEALGAVRNHSAA